MSNDNDLIIGDKKLPTHTKCKVSPFLAMLNTDRLEINGHYKENKEILVTTSTGWIMHVYGDFAAVVHVPYGVEQEAYAVKTQIVAIAEFLHVLIEKGWRSFIPLDGTKLMKRLFWIESQRYDNSADGDDEGNEKKVSVWYVPTEEEKQCCESIIEYAKNNGLTWKYSLPEVNQLSEQD